MQHINKNLAFYLWLSGTIAATLVIASFLWQGNLRFSLQDESYLWYGVQRVLQGEVPIRDFMAYDPGRYYWSATILRIMGDNSIMDLRMAIALFQLCGLTVGIALVASAVRRWDNITYGFLTLAAIILTTWMFPRHKLFDISTSLFLVGALYLLFQHPNNKRHFLLGACVGLAAVIGRNHGVYGLLASMFAIAWLGIGSISFLHLIKRYFLWGLGVLTGFSPIMYMVVMIPGFAQAFWDSILFLFQIEATNIPLPIPWPWDANVMAMNKHTLHAVILGLFFLSLPIGGVASLCWLCYCRIHTKPIAPAFAAASFLILPYAHVAFSRADAPHLAQGIFPLLIAILTALAASATIWRWSLTALICLISAWLMYPAHPGGRCNATRCTPLEVSGDTLYVTPKEEADITLIYKVARTYAAAGENFIATPLWPGAYAILEKKAPMWAIYNLFPHSPAFQKQEIMRMQAANPRFALIQNHALGRQENLRFENTNPLIYEYIQTRFILESRNTRRGYEIYRAKDDIAP